VNRHIDELAELYALGTLDEEERALVDAHALECTSCAARLGEAESTIASMERSAPVPASLDRRMSGVFARRRAFAVPGALAAAALIVGLLLSGWSLQLLRSAQAFDTDRQQAVVAMVLGHFAHAQFQSVAVDAPKAKLIYARNGAWVFAVAQTSRALSLRASTPHGEVALGTLHVQGNAAELFVAQPPAAGVFALYDGNREIGRVTLSRR
jgi:Putative zinc-finger